MVPLKNIYMKWSKNCILVVGTAENKNPRFKRNEVKLCCCSTISTQENIKLFKQLESGFKRTINWNKYLPKTTNQARNKDLGFLIDPSFQGLFVLLFKDDDGRESRNQYL